MTARQNKSARLPCAQDLFQLPPYVRKAYQSMRLCLRQEDFSQNLVETSVIPCLLESYCCLHRCRSRKILGVAQDFCPKFPKLAWKVFVRLCLQIFSHKDHEDLSCVTSTKIVLTWFSANVRCRFVNSNNVRRHFCPDFQDFCPDFRQTKTFGCELAPPHPCLLHH